MRHDAKLIFVAGTIDIEGKSEKYVLCRQRTARGEKYYAVERKKFLEGLETREQAPQYRRCGKSRTVSEKQARSIYERGGEYPPASTVRQTKAAPIENGSEHIVAKAMCESYLRDLRLCASGPRARGDYRRAKENIALLDGWLRGELKQYAGYFRERFAEGLSIRGYAQKHGINRGSVAYIQKKFFAALAECIRRAQEAPPARSGEEGANGKDTDIL